MFQETHGTTHRVSDNARHGFPAGPQDRRIPMLNENTPGVTGWFLEPHHLC